MNMEHMVVKSEEQAWKLLEEALLQHDSHGIQLRFDSWPRFKITLKGEDFHGTIPTRVMPPILELQKNIHRAYCKAKYNTDDTRCLKEDEREALELIVEIHEGSTDFIVDLAKVLNEIAETTGMNGTEMVFLLLGMGVIWTARLGWKDWLAEQERKHQQCTTVHLSEEETKRAELLQKTTEKVAEVAEAAIQMNEFRSSMVKRMKNRDVLQSDGEEIINGAHAKVVASEPKEVAKEVRLDGDYRIDEVKFPKEFGGEYRFLISSIDNQRSFFVVAAPTVLNEQQIQALQDSSFKVRTACMQINGKELRGNITRADLVGIELAHSE